MNTSRAIAILAVLLAVTAFAESAPAPVKNTYRKATKSAVRAKSDVEDSQRTLALRLLQQSEAESGVLDASGRAGLLYLTGEIYTAVDKPKARELLQSAYQNALIAYDQRPDAVQFLLGDLVSAAVKIAPETVEQSLPQDMSARDTALRFLVKHHLARNDTNHSIELLTQMTSDDAITYAAIDLLMALPASRQDARDRVFALALQSYKNSRHFQVGTGSPEDLGTLVVRFHDDIGRGLIEEAIDVLLRESKTMPQYVVMSTAQKTVTFSSYRFRLFQLLPTLRKLDPDRAASLVKEENETASLLRQYPEGQRSVDPWLRDTPMQDGEVRSTNYAYVRDNSPQAQANTMEVDRTVGLLAHQAESNPDSAIASAARLADASVRTDLLLQIATASQGKNSVASKAALRQILATPPANPNLYRRVRRAAELAHQLGDDNLANSLIDLGLKFARSLYDFESDKDDPNWALKVNWVSVRAYREFLELQIKLAPDAALQNVKDLPDGELRAIAQAMIAASLLHVPLPATSPVGKTPRSKPS